MKKLLISIFTIIVAASVCSNLLYANKNDAEVKLLDTNHSKNRVYYTLKPTETAKPTVLIYKPKTKANVSQRITMPTNNESNLIRELLSKQSTESSAPQQKRHKHVIEILGYIAMVIAGCALLGWLASLIFAPRSGLTWALIGGLIPLGLILVAFLLIMLFLILLIPSGFHG